MDPLLYFCAHNKNLTDGNKSLNDVLKVLSHTKNVLTAVCISFIEILFSKECGEISWKGFSIIPLDFIFNVILYYDHIRDKIDNEIMDKSPSPSKK